ncbi:MAG TPA: hypothetical protein VE619_05355, partial [Nitrososphaeraceae archaeon]|nr:hypothetical protein [Nitrososphaeraceae archaeon]
PKYTRITQLTIKNMNLIFSQRNKKASSVAKKFGNSFEFGNTRIEELTPNELIKLAKSMEI